MHVYGELARYPVRQTHHVYTAPDANLDRDLKMRDIIGFSRSVFVQPTVYGTDHTFLKDTLRAFGNSKNIRGVALVDETLSDAELKESPSRRPRCARFIFR